MATCVGGDIVVVKFVSNALYVRACGACVCVRVSACVCQNQNHETTTTNSNIMLNII